MEAFIDLNVPYNVKMKGVYIATENRPTFQVDWFDSACFQYVSIEIQ